jgi:hypothetical protein
MIGLANMEAVMTIRIWRCWACKHKNRFGCKRCSFCYYDAPFWNRNAALPPMLLAGVTLSLLAAMDI